MKKIVMIMTITLVLAIANIAQAAVPHLIRYQGYISDKNTPPQGLNGDYTMKFSLYTSQEPQEGEVSLWEEVYDAEKKVKISNGQFSVLLGSISPLDNINWQDALWLAVEVNGEAMQERQRITSVPFALKAEEAISAQKAKTIEGDVLYVDTENKRVGIGTTQPQATLEVAGDTDTYTKLLLHLNGQDGSTSFTDETGKSVTANGNAQIDTEQFKFGGGSGLFDGTGDYLSLADSDDWNFGTGDFTIDCQVRYNELTNGAYISTERAGATYFYFVYDAGNQDLIFDAELNGAKAYTHTANISLSTNIWYHVAYVRSGNAGKFFVNGKQVGSDGNFTGATMPDTTGVLYISLDGGTSYLNAWIDELRISKGIARWTEDFSDKLPTREYLYGGGDAIFAGKVGIGTTNPTYPLHMGGGAYCTGSTWVNASSQDLKKDIRKLYLSDYHNMLDALDRIEVVRYRYKDELDTDKLRIGLIAEDVPQELANKDRKGIDTADAIGFLLAVVKAQQEEIKKLKEVIGGD